MEYTVSISEEESIALERLWYEKRTVTGLISFFVYLCADKHKEDMLAAYISDYKRDLEQNIAHEAVLIEDIAKRKLPNYKGAGEDFKYFANFDKGEVTFIYGGQ